MSKRKESPAVDSLLGLSKPAQRPAARPKKATKKQKQTTATYYIGDDLKEQIRQISVKWGVSASQVAKYLLLFSIDAFHDGSLPHPTLSPSDSPAYRHNIDFEDE